MMTWSRWNVVILLSLIFLLKCLSKSVFIKTIGNVGKSRLSFFPFYRFTQLCKFRAWSWYGGDPELCCLGFYSVEKHWKRWRSSRTVEKGLSYPLEVLVKNFINRWKKIATCWKFLRTHWSCWKTHCILPVQQKTINPFPSKRFPIDE